MSSEPATNNNTLISDRSSKTGGVADSFDRSSKREGVADSLDRSSKFGTGSYTSSGQTSGSVIARLPSSSQQRGSPPKCKENTHTHTHTHTHFGGNTLCTCTD